MFPLFPSRPVVVVDGDKNQMFWRDLGTSLVMFVVTKTNILSQKNYLFLTLTKLVSDHDLSVATTKQNKKIKINLKKVPT